MRGRPVGEQLEKVRSVSCARSGLKIVHDGAPKEGEVNRLHHVYLSPVDSYIQHMTARIDELCKKIRINENPTDAIELTMVAGLLVDRMTNKQLIEEGGYRRTRDGVAFDSQVVHSTKEQVPYKGKDE